jgi:hypothetical protein
LAVCEKAMHLLTVLQREAFDIMHNALVMMVYEIIVEALKDHH